MENYRCMALLISAHHKKLDQSRLGPTRADQSRPEQSSPSLLLRVPLAGETVRGSGHLHFHPHLEPSLPDFPSQAPPRPLPSTEMDDKDDGDELCLAPLGSRTDAGGKIFI